MKIDVVFTQQAIQPEHTTNKVVVVIDVLRATSLIATALYHGYNAVYAVATPQQALALKKQHPHWLLAGERHADKIEGFDFSNSPHALINSHRKDNLVLCTTNGTQALAKIQKAKAVYSLAFVNMQAVAKHLSQCPHDITIICAGTHGHLSLDDSLAAGHFLNTIKPTQSPVLSDAALMLQQWAQHQHDLHHSLQQAAHYKTLLQKDLQEDIDICLTPNSMPIVPQWHHNHFTL